MLITVCVKFTQTRHSVSCMDSLVLNQACILLTLVCTLSFVWIGVLITVCVKFTLTRHSVPCMDSLVLNKACILLTLMCTVCGILMSLTSSPSSKLELLLEEGCSRLPCLSRRGRSSIISMATGHVISVPCDT